MTNLRVWAPNATTVAVRLDDGRRPMTVSGDAGWWEVELPGLEAGTSYGFVVDDGDPRPDPRGVWLPDGVHGLNRVYDQRAYDWADEDWRGLALPGAVVYELHVGTFTAEGTFAAAAERLDHLVALGVDVVELLPVHAFPGIRGWGYDVAAPYAVHEPYGGPDALKAFVDACHAKGLGVALDVVYNHLGPDGAYLVDFGPYLTDTYTTPWGPAVNLDGPGSDDVRAYLVDNALMWLRDFHLDGLRIDAVHAFVDRSATHLLEELTVAVEALAARTGRARFLVAESDLGDPRVITSRARYGYGIDAQWSDDFHHALHVTLTGETAGYYADFAAGIDDLATALREGYVYTGQHSVVRGRRHGRAPEGVAGWQLLGYLQNHDQIGNRARGERSSALLSPGLQQVAAALVLTAPFTPMLFMGEEWGASTPWQYFTDHGDTAIADLVRSGRRAEFAGFGWRPEDVPDPQDPATFTRSTLDWSEVDREPHRSLLAWHRKLIALRRRVPELASGRLGDAHVDHADDGSWLVVRRGDVVVAANLGPDRRQVLVGGAPTHVLAASERGWSFRNGSIDLPGESVAIATIR
ncbi:MAG: malto-oligosyltrehalose trehalohydrolase [Streptosporangiales bacterium]|nr:malto-oligosyltrehalose trehalohydrolase [Streptosporangiales bacterium]